MNTDIEQKRKLLGWSQADLAKRIGVDQSTVSRIEAGQLPSRPVQMLLDAVFAQQEKAA